jgi:rod shape-determining protein MreD
MNTKTILPNLIRFIVLLLAQVFIFNKINLGGWLNPMVYPLFILLLPFETNKNLSLVLAFILGLTIDLFTGSIGLHAGALVFMAFMRPVSFNLISSSKNYETGIMPGISDLGYVWFITYTFFLVFMHHLFFFFAETFSFSEFGSTLLRIFLSTIVSSILIIIIDILFKPNPKRR